MDGMTIKTKDFDLLKAYEWETNHNSSKLILKNKYDLCMEIQTTDNKKKRGKNLVSSNVCMPLNFYKPPDDITSLVINHFNKRGTQECVIEASAPS